MHSLFNGQVADVESFESLVLKVDADEQIVEIEFKTESFQETLVELSQFIVLGLSFNFSLALRAKEDMSSSLSKVESEAIPVLLFVIINSSLDLGGDLNTIVDDVTCNVPGE